MILLILIKIKLHAITEARHDIYNGYLEAVYI